MTKYHYATVPLSAFFAVASFPKPSDSYLADDEESRAINGLIQNGYRLVASHEQSDVAILELVLLDQFPPKVNEVWREFIKNNARPGDVANLILENEALRKELGGKK